MGLEMDAAAVSEEGMPFFLKGRYLFKGFRGKAEMIQGSFPELDDAAHPLEHIDAAFRMHYENASDHDHLYFFVVRAGLIFPHGDIRSSGGGAKAGSVASASAFASEGPAGCKRRLLRMVTKGRFLCLQDNKVYAYYKHKLEEGFPKLISAVFPGIPDHLDAAVVCPEPDCEDNEVIFFKGGFAPGVRIRFSECSSAPAAAARQNTRSTTSTWTTRRWSTESSRPCPTARRPSATWSTTTASTDTSSPNLIPRPERCTADTPRRPATSS